MIITQANDKDIRSENIVILDKDGIHVRHNYSSVVGCRIINNVPHKGHLDAIQFIPMLDHWALGKLEHVRVRHNHILSAANLQGISGFDGIFSRFVITENEIKTTSHHKITLNGLLDGVIRGNVDSLGKPIKAVLNPARIGGGANIWVVSFADTYEYKDIDGDPSQIDDERDNPKKKGWVLKKFPLMEFRRQYRRIMEGEKLLGATAQAKAASDLALKLCENKIFNA